MYQHTDIQDSRQRRDPPAQQQQQRTQPQSTPTQAVATPPRAGLATSPVGSQARSYTEQRLLEQDFYREVVEKASHSFIDVSQNAAAGVDARDAEERKGVYKEHLASIKLHPGSQVLFSLPAAHSGNSASALADAPKVSSDERAAAASAIEKIDAAVQALKIEPVGELVIEFTGVAAM